MSKFVYDMFQVILLHHPTNSMMSRAWTDEEETAPPSVLEDFSPSGVQEPFCDLSAASADLHRTVAAEGHESLTATISTATLLPE